jgi:hypothetical protein
LDLILVLGVFPQEVNDIFKFGPHDFHIFRVRPIQASQLLGQAQESPSQTLMHPHENIRALLFHVFPFE